MNRKEAFIGLNMGYKRVTDMLKVFGEPQKIFKASPEKLKQFYGIGEEISRAIKEWKEDKLKEDLKLIQKFKVKVVTFEVVVEAAKKAALLLPPALPWNRAAQINLCCCERQLN